MTSVSTQTPLGDSKNGGALFTIPREIRDKIYRLLLKRSCAVFTSRNITWDSRCLNDIEYDKPSLVILRVSRAISREAQDLLYSESDFRITVDFDMHLDELKPLPQSLSRAKKISIKILTLGSNKCVHQDRHWWHAETVHDPAEFSHRMETICQATIDRFTGLQTHRDSCRIYLRNFGSPKFFPITDYILPRLGALQGFDTIVMGVLMESHWQHEGPVDEEFEETSTDLQRFRPEMEDILEPTLGPAAGGGLGIAFRLSFWPREHMESLLDAEGTEDVIGG